MTWSLVPWRISVGVSGFGASTDGSLRAASGERALVAAEAGAQLGGVGERLGVEVDGLVAERPRMGPEATGVEGGDVPPPLARRGQLGGQRVCVGALATEVVAGLARRAGVGDGGHLGLHVRHRRVEQHHPVDPLRMAQGELLDHRAAQVAAEHDDRFEAELVVHERVQVAGVARARRGTRPGRRRCRRSRAGRGRSRRTRRRPAAGSPARRSRLLSGQPCTHSNGTPPGFTRTNA